MEIGTAVMSIVSAFTLMVGMYPHGHQIESLRPSLQSVSSSVDTVDYAATKKLICKAGTKPGKTPISLAVGGKVACYNIAVAKAGKKLLISDYTKSCFGCHSPTGINPVTLMNSNLRTQGYTLKPASITAAFNAHADQMLGAVISAKDAKSISVYLQSIK